MQNELERFIGRPTGRNYLRVRDCILGDTGRHPDPEDLAELEVHWVEGRYQALCERMEDLLPEWGLSPRFYWLGAVAARELGELEAAETDRFLYQTCLRGLLDTGDGSLESPFLLTYASDEEELLHRLQLDRTSSALVRSPHGLCHVVSGQDGRELCFLLECLSARELEMAQARCDLSRRKPSRLRST
jgi:hypothetical protein